MRKKGEGARIAALSCGSLGDLRESEEFSAALALLAAPVKGFGVCFLPAGFAHKPALGRVGAERVEVEQGANLLALAPA